MPFPIDTKRRWGAVCDGWEAPVASET